MSESHTRNRGKPLRTYGKRTASASDLSHHRLRKRLCQIREFADSSSSACSPPASSKSDAVEQTSESMSSPDGSSPAKLSLQVENAPTSSILRYFKPVSSDKRAVPVNTETRRLPTDPPSSPTCQSYIEAKPRLHFLRPRRQSSRAAATSESVIDAGRSSSIDKLSSVGTSPQRQVLECQPDGSRNPSLAGSCAEKEQNLDEETVPSSRLRRKAKTRKPPTVQTTLNISTHAAFAECSLCDTVWNPLYPDDVKYHLKRHAMAMRLRRKRGDQWP